jgi:hypothetical protein
MRVQRLKRAFAVGCCRPRLVGARRGASAISASWKGDITSIALLRAPKGGGMQDLATASRCSGHVLRRTYRSILMQTSSNRSENS